MSALSRACIHQLRSATSNPSTVWRTICPMWRNFVSAGGSGDSSDNNNNNNNSNNNNNNNNAGNIDNSILEKKNVNDGDKKEEKEETMFDMDDFLTSDDTEDKDEKEDEKDISEAIASMELESKEKGIDNLTSEMATELVNKLVESSKTKSSLSSDLILPYISNHTIHVLKASRISSNYVYASASGQHEYSYPICRKVTAYLDVSLLDLSPSARQALILLAGRQRLVFQKVDLKYKATRLRPFQRIDYEQHDEYQQNFEQYHKHLKVKVSCNKFPTRQENKAWVVTRLHHLVAQAKHAVGEPVDDQQPLDEWNDVVDQVKQEADDQIKLVGDDVNNLLATNKIKTSL